MMSTFVGRLPLSLTLITLAANAGVTYCRDLDPQQSVVAVVNVYQISVRQAIDLRAEIAKARKTLDKPQDRELIVDSKIVDVLLSGLKSRGNVSSLVSGKIVTVAGKTAVLSSTGVTPARTPDGLAGIQTREVALTAKHSANQTIAIEYEFKATLLPVETAPVLALFASGKATIRGDEAILHFSDIAIEEKAKSVSLMVVSAKRNSPDLTRPPGLKSHEVDEPQKSKFFQPIEP